MNWMKTIHALTIYYLLAFALLLIGLYARACVILHRQPIGENEEAEIFGLNTIVYLTKILLFVSPLVGSISIIIYFSAVYRRAKFRKHLPV